MNDFKYLEEYHELEKGLCVAVDYQRQLKGSQLADVVREAISSGRDKPVNLAVILSAAKEDNDIALAIARSNLKRVDDIILFIDGHLERFLTVNIAANLTPILSNLRSETIRSIQILNAGAGE